MTSTVLQRRKAGRVSVQAIRWARQQRTGSPVSKAVLYVLADHHNAGSGLCCPSTRTIAEEADTDQRTARRHLDALRERGLIDWSGGYGRGRNRYSLPLGSEGQDPSPDDARSEGRDPSLDGDGVRGETPHDADRSEAQQNRSEALILRSEATRASDQQEQKSKRTTYRSELQEAAPTAPTAPTRARAGSRVREHVSPAELNATAHSPAASALVRSWIDRNPGLLYPHRRTLTRAVEDLIRAGADPALVPAAIDEAHSNPRWKNPAASLQFAYQDVHRRTSAPAAGPRNTTDANIAALLQAGGPLAEHPGQHAIGGA